MNGREAGNIARRGENMHTIQFEISKPTEEAAFEDMCARIYGAVYLDPLPQTNGRRGQAQGGVDVFVDSPDGRVGIQCKRYADGALKFKHVEHEVSLADKAKAPVVLLIIATTAASDATLLKQVQELSDARVAAGDFPVKIEFWQDLCRHIRGRSELQNDYAPNAPGAVFQRIEEGQAALRTSVLELNARLDVSISLPSGRLDSVNMFITGQQDSVNELLVSGRFKDALDALKPIGADMGLLDTHQQARWHVQQGICTWHLDSGTAAAPSFLRAVEIFPDDEKIAAAGVRGLLLAERVEEALVAGAAALARYPVSAHVWGAYANARMVGGEPLSIADAPVGIRDNCDVMQLVAWSRKKAGDMRGAVDLSLAALDAQDAGFFVRSTALVLSLEVVAADAVKAAHLLVPGKDLDALRRATAAFEPRSERVWRVQSAQSLDDTLTHLGYAYMLLGRADEALTLVDEARHASALSPRLKRVALEAYSRLERHEELIRHGRKWLDQLEEEALVLVAEVASPMGDVDLVEGARRCLQERVASDSLTLELLGAFRWVALWHTADGQSKVLEEVRAAGLASSPSLVLVTVGARILNEAEDADGTDAAIAQAEVLATKESNPSTRLIHADMLFATGRFQLAAKHYEALATPGFHSELHNKLLRCYLRLGTLRKARELVLSFPEGWTSDERALALAIDLGRLASDYEFLVPLTLQRCEARPNDAGAWVLRLGLDLKLQRMSRFHGTLKAVPRELDGAPRLLAHIASLELRFGDKAAGIRRLYGLFRRHLDDPKTASAYFMAIIVGPKQLPYMDEALLTVVAGSTVTLNGPNGEVKLTIDPEGDGDFPLRDGFVSASAAPAQLLIGAAVGHEVVFPGAFGTETRMVISHVGSAYRHLLQIAQQVLTSPLATDVPIVSFQVPKTEEGADFSEVHAMLKKQSFHGRQTLQGYGEGPLTLGLVAELLGKSPVDVVTGWPSSDAPPLFVCAGMEVQRVAALKELGRADCEYVVDAATVAELGVLDSLQVLGALPRVYISAQSVAVLEEAVERVKAQKSPGSLIDDDGQMRFVEVTEQQRASEVKFLQGLVDAVAAHCTAAPAYGPQEVPADFQRARDVLADEEYSALLLAAEKSAALLTVDGRLGQLGAAALNLSVIWPQVLLQYMAIEGHITGEAYAQAVNRMLVRNRAFVSVSPADLVFMCMQGGVAMQAGLQKFKEMLSSPASDYASTCQVAFQFLEHQAHLSLQMHAFHELLGHFVEALLRHPACDRKDFLKLVADFVGRMVNMANSPDGRYAAIDDWLDQRAGVYAEFLAEAVRIGIARADEPARRRPFKLLTVKCTRVPRLQYDGSVGDVEDAELLPADAPSSESADEADEPLATAGSGG